jgi:hypothetical protein
MHWVSRYYFICNSSRSQEIRRAACSSLCTGHNISGWGVSHRKGSAEREHVSARLRSPKNEINVLCPFFRKKECDALHCKKIMSAIRARVSESCMVTGALAHYTQAGRMKGTHIGAPSRIPGQREAVAARPFPAPRSGSLGGGGIVSSLGPT